MEGQLAVPFHFAAEFLILAVCAGASLDAIRRAADGGGARAVAHAIGFAALAGAQVVHGARIPGAVEDGALISIALRALGFALVVVGGVGFSLPSRPDVPSIAMAVSPGLFVSGKAAQLALVAGVAAGAAAVRGVAAHRRDQDPATFAFAAAFALFAGGEIALALARPGGGTSLSVSHVLRLAGALVLARWLAPAIGRSVRLRFVTAFVLALTVLVLVLSAALNAVIDRNLEREELRRVEVTASSAATAVANQRTTDHQSVRNLAGASGSTVPSAVTLSSLACFFPDMDLLVSVDAGGRPVASALKPRRACDTSNILVWVTNNPSPPVPPALRLGMAGSEVVATALRGRSNGSLEVVQPGTLAIVGSAPIGPPVRPVGALAFGRILDAALLKRISGGGDVELTVLLGGQPTATSGRDARAIASAFADRALASRVRRVVEEERGTLGTGVDIGGTRGFCSFVPLRRSGGEVVGVLAACSTQAGVRASQQALNRVLFLIALAAAAIAAAIASAAGGRVARPIRRLTAAAEAIRRGDLSARAEGSSPDELGALARSFNQMAASLDRSTADLRSAADTEVELRERMEAIMQSMDDGLLATDEQGRIVTANLAAERLTGVVVDDMTGRPLGEVVRGADAIGRNIAEVALASGAAAATLEQPSGETVPIAITSTPLRAGGREAGRVVVLRDISVEVQAEKMKSEFLSNVSHELRTPLTPIKGYTEILKRKKFPKEKAEAFLDGILESTARLERIVEILVDFAALEAGRLKPRTEPVALKPFVSRLVGRWRERGTGRFTIKVPSTIPAVDADPRLLTKVIDELIDNAVKFSPEGVRVEIEASPVSNGSRSRRPSAVRLAVRDRGIGIAADKMPSLFRDFVQLDGSETREFGGLGLGLAYVKRVAAAHGGDVAAESQPGRGSTFSLTLPVARKAAK